MTKPYPHQPLGNFIRAVDVRNSSGAVTLLLGVSVNKSFIPSVANTIGTDMTKYKVVKKGQFVYVPVTSRNGEKITVALLEEAECIVSQAYTVFEVTEGAGLLSEYLMLWFLRPEFDRYARFHSHGSAREVFDWVTLCATLIPVPPIAEQERIVSQFAAIEERMRQCRECIALLERAATALYRKTFVEGIDRNHLPEGWRMGTLGEVAAFCYGKMPQVDKQGIVPVFSGYGIVGYTHQEMFKYQHIIVIARGDSGSGKVVLSPESFFLTNLSIAVLLGRDAGMRYYLYHHLRELDITSLRSGSAQAQITISSLEMFGIVIPPLALCSKYEELAKTLNKSMDNHQRQLTSLEKLKAVLLTQMK
ncbi:restriction endonuclease subunit S [Porphyromonas sp.]